MIQGSMIKFYLKSEEIELDFQVSSSWFKRLGFIVMHLLHFINKVKFLKLSGRSVYANSSLS